MRFAVGYYLSSFRNRFEILYVVRNHQISEVNEIVRISSLIKNNRKDEGVPKRLIGGKTAKLRRSAYRHV